MTCDHTSAQDKMPIPKDKVSAITALGTGISNAGSAMGQTQIILNGTNVEGWVGTAGTAYEGSATQLQQKIQEAVDCHPGLPGQLESYTAAITTARTAVTDARTAWDDAVSAHTRMVGALANQVYQGTQAELDAEVANAESTCTEARNQAKSNYDKAITALSEAASAAANGIKALTASFAPEDSVTGGDGHVDRDDLGMALFGGGDDILAMEAQWANADADAQEAAAIFADGIVTEEEMNVFLSMYGSRTSDPYFAHALAQYVSADQLFTALSTTHDVWAGSDEFLGAIGELLVVSTGGTDASNSNTDTWNVASQVLRDKEGNDISEFEFAFADQIKRAGTYVYSDGVRYDNFEDVPDDHVPRYDTSYRMAYGYQWLGAALNQASEDSSLVLGGAFLQGRGGRPELSIAADMLRWDYDHVRDDRMAFHGTNNPENLLSKDRTPVDPIEAMFALMDAPTAADGEDIPQSRLDSINATRILNNASFLGSNSLMNDAEGHPLNTTEYLVGHRGIPADTNVGRYDAEYRNYTDNGQALGELINESTKDSSNPNSYEIIQGFLEGYSAGLEADWGSGGLFGDDRGQDAFGYGNRNLRALTGEILAPYMDDITEQLHSSTGADGARAYVEREGDLSLQLSETLRDKLLDIHGSDAGLFADLAFDTDTSNGRDPSLVTLAKANEFYMQRDLIQSMEGVEGSSAVPDVVARYTSAYTLLEQAAHTDNIKLGAEDDKISNAIWAVVNDGIGVVPVGDFISTNSGFDDLIFKHGIQGVEEHIAAHGNSEATARAEQDASLTDVAAAMKSRYDVIYGQYANAHPEILPPQNSDRSWPSFMENGQIKPINKLNTPDEQQDYAEWVKSQPLPNGWHATNEAVHTKIGTAVTDMKDWIESQRN